MRAPAPSERRDSNPHVPPLLEVIARGIEADGILVVAGGEHVQLGHQRRLCPGVGRQGTTEDEQEEAEAPHDTIGIEAPSVTGATSAWSTSSCRASRESRGRATALLARSRAAVVSSNRTSCVRYGR